MYSILVLYVGAFMQAIGIQWTPDRGLTVERSTGAPEAILIFGSREAIANPGLPHALRARFPTALVIGCSTGGQIFKDDVIDDLCSGVGLSFERTGVTFASATLAEAGSSFGVGQQMAAALDRPGLAGVFVLADGLAFDGTELVAGLASRIGTTVPVMGGLAGDGARFAETIVFDGVSARSGAAVALGFYGPAIHIGHGSAGGWDVFGPRRSITRASGNVLHELDGKPALDLYKRYLGEEANDLPGSGLLFPLRIFDPANPEHDVVRTLLAVDHERGSITFAGTMPQGWTAQLMRGSIDRLTRGASDAARQAGSAEAGNGVAVLVSCIGRRLLMGQRVNEEIEAVRLALPAGIPLAGFYSYGEISPHARSGASELHNQTMTVMTLNEIAA